jgi:hypothetical protein
MATFVGRNGVVEIAANTVANIRSFEVTTEAGTIDNTVMGGTWETHDLGFKRWNGSLSCLWDDTDTNGQEVILEGASLVLHFKPEGTDAGDEDYTGTATVTQVTRRAAHDGLVEASFTFQGSDALTVGVDA